MQEEQEVIAVTTIKDVAKDAGVSVGTVSNVINGARVGKEIK